MKKIISFSDLEFEECHDGVQALVKLKNGYEVSVVKHGGSYGSDKGLYEMACFGSKGDMITIPEWDEEVKGWLKPEDVEKEIALIQAL